MLLVKVVGRDLWFGLQVILMKIIGLAFSDVSELLISFHAVKE